MLRWQPQPHPTAAAAAVAAIRRPGLITRMCPADAAPKAHRDAPPRSWPWGQLSAGGPWQCAYERLHSWVGIWGLRPPQSGGWLGPVSRGRGAHSRLAPCGGHATQPRGRRRSAQHRGSTDTSPIASCRLAAIASLLGACCLSCVLIFPSGWRPGLSPSSATWHAAGGPVGLCSLVRHLACRLPVHTGANAMRMPARAVPVWSGNEPRPVN